MSIFNSTNHGSCFFTDMIETARAGHFALPTFQRGFVWGEGDILALLDSIWRGYPIGYLLLWGDHWRAHAQDVRSFRGCAEPVPHAALVLDGQQRIQAMIDATTPGSGYAYELAGDRFVKVASPRLEEGLIPCDLLVDWSAYMQAMHKWGNVIPRPERPAPAPAAKGKRKIPPPAVREPESPEYESFLMKAEQGDRVLCRVKDTRIGYIQIARDQPLDFAREVFRRLNLTGKPFTEEEVFACLK